MILLLQIVLGGVIGFLILAAIGIYVAITDTKEALENDARARSLRGMGNSDTGSLDR